MSASANAFGALLRYWRNARGLSQLDLAASAAVSSRHLSFLETGRARPSREMVLQLAATLDVPMREQNALLRAAGFADAFADPGIGDALDPQVRRTVERMMSQQEPYPLVVMDSHYNVMMMNHAAQHLFVYALGERASLLAPVLNAFRLAFDPQGLRPVIRDWESTAKQLLLRLQREVMQRPADSDLKHLLSTLCGYPDVPSDWRTPDLETPTAATFNLQLTLDGDDYAFLTALTVFNAPLNITVEELRLESYFPLDAATDSLCRRLAERSAS